jgi:MFS family permease
VSRQQATDPVAGSSSATARRWWRRHWAGGPRFTLGLAIALQVVISAGDGLAMIALATRIYQNSHASWAVASVFLAVTVPITALAPVAGTVLDRFSPRPVLVAAAAAEALVALALIRVDGTGATLGLAVGFGICAAVLQPGLGAIVPRLAGRTGLTRANGYLQAATWGGFTLGPLLATGLIAAGGAGLALAAVAVIYGIGALGLRALRLAPPGTADPAAGTTSGTAPTTGTEAGMVSPPARATDLAAGHPQPAMGYPEPPMGPAGPPAGPPEPAKLARQMSAGLRFLRADREAGLLVVVVGVVVGFGNMAVVAEVVFAEGVLKAGPSGYSILVAAWTAGMLAGTLAGGRLPTGRLAVVTLAGTVAAGTGVALAGAAVSLWQAAAAYGFGGLANGMEVVATRSFLNHRVPEAISGRVFALYSGVLFGTASLGMAVAGGLLSPLNPRVVLFIAGGGCVLAGATGWVVHSRLRAR